MFLSKVEFLANMQPLSHYLGVPKQTEVLLLTLVGICCTIFDAFFLDLNSNLRKVWETALDPRKVSGNSQIYLKYLLSGIILIRTFSVHLYLAFYIVMLWPAIFEERPALLLPWLIVGAVKCLGMGFMAFCTGMFTCFAYGVYRPACLDFVIAQIIDHTPSFYMWFCVLSYYRELKMCVSIVSYEQSKTDLESEITMRRRKVRSMADNIILKHHCSIDEDRHLISVSTIENIVQQLTTDLHRKTTRSLDSLLGIMAAEAEKEELMNLCDDLPSEEIGLTIQEKTAKLLKLTKEEIIEAQNKKKLGKGMVFTISMLDIKSNLLDDVHTVQNFPNLSKAADRSLSLRTDNLRVTKSEKGEITSSDYSKYGANTEFMANISETEIGSVLNYSTASLLAENEEEAVLYKKVEQELISQRSLPSLQSKNGKETETEKQPEVKKWQKDPLLKTSDFGCQASTLSRNVLEVGSIDLQRYINDRLSTPKKTSPRTPLTKPPGKDAPKIKKNSSKLEGNNYKKNIGKQVKEIKPAAKVEVSKKNSSFKTDGYTMAYNEKMQANAMAEKTPRPTEQDKPL